MFEHSMIDGELKIELPEQLSAKTHDEVRSGIYEVIDSKPGFTALTLNMIHTAYISSSGLRIINELVKKYPSLSVVNANRDVYDIFELSGFTELFPISRQKKQVSIEGCPLIGRGANGEVYRYDEDTVLKVYSRPGARLEDIERERQLARKAFILGVPTALTLDTVTVGPYYGVMYEMIGADSVLGYVYKNPSDYDAYILKFADGMKLINSIQTNRDPLLADKKKEFCGWKNDVSHLFTAQESEELDQLIASIPDDKTLVHGDYHLANVMLQGDELLLIDMETLGYGSRLFELANYFFVMKGFSLLDNVNHLYRLDRKDLDHCWDLVIERIYEGTEDSVKQRELCQAGAIGLLRLLRFGMRRNMAPENMQIVKTELLNRVRWLSS